MTTSSSPEPTLSTINDKLDKLLDKFSLDAAVLIQRQKSAESIITQQQAMINALESEVSVLTTQKTTLDQNLTRAHQNHRTTPIKRRRTMTPEQQRIAIAEACKTLIERGCPSCRGDGCNACNGSGTASPDSPDYLNNLNAMHEAEKVVESIMHERGDDYAYGDKLVEVAQDPRPIHATASQRAEAFLRTLNLWKD